MGNSLIIASGAIFLVCLPHPISCFSLCDLSLMVVSLHAPFWMCPSPLSQVHQDVVSCGQAPLLYTQLLRIASCGAFVYSSSARLDVFELEVLNGLGLYIMLHFG